MPTNSETPIRKIRSPKSQEVFAKYLRKPGRAKNWDIAVCGFRLCEAFNSKLFQTIQCAF